MQFPYPRNSWHTDHTPFYSNEMRICLKKPYNLVLYVMRTSGVSTNYTRLENVSF